MQYRPLGTTGLSVSALAFGAGPVSGLMTTASFEQQLATVRRAVDLGVNWFDTAPGYGQGRSEENLGRVLQELNLGSRCHVATKVRLSAEQLGEISAAVHASVRDSLSRLRRPHVGLLQLHNSITPTRGEEPTSITPADVLGRGGVLEAFRELKAAGQIGHFGLTGIGQPEALREVIRSGEFAAIQMPYHVLNPSAGRAMPAGFSETNNDHLMADCAAAGVAVLAIRVFAAGALLGAGPSAHTRQTPFFPLDLYERDRRRADRLAAALGERLSLKELALRFVLGDPRVTTAIIGFGSPDHVQDAVEIGEAGPLPPRIRAEIEAELLRVWADE